MTTIMSSTSTSQIQQHEINLVLQNEMIITCSLFSKCGNYLIASNNYGYINVWYLNTKPLHNNHNNNNSNDLMSIDNKNSNKINDNSQQDQSNCLNLDLLNNTQQYCGNNSCHYGFKAHATAINCLLFYSDSQLLSSDDTEIKSWSWSDIVNAIKNNINEQKNQETHLDIYNMNNIVNRYEDLPTNSLFVLPSPQKEGVRGSLSERSEINGLDVDKFGRLYIGCGDSNAYCWDINKNQVITVFKGHKDYVHQVKYNNFYNTLISTSEDATVRIWDCNTAQCQTILSPGQKKSISNNSTQQAGSSINSSGSTIFNSNKNSSGSVSSTSSSSSSGSVSNNQSSQILSSQWTGALDLDANGNWLVVGGSSLTMWYLGKLNTMSAQLCNQPLESFHSVVFEKDRVIACGTKGVVNHYALDGKLLMEVPSTSDILYTVSCNPHPRNQIVVAAGTSPLINTYINQENIAFSYCFGNCK